jgi:hypothetical protein
MGDRERIEARTQIDPQTGCWNWTGTLRPDGYGVIVRGDKSGRLVRAHRLAYQTLVGPIPKGLVIDHLCRNKACVNPDHLEAVTQRVNTLRGSSPVARRSEQTHCVNGHELAGDNIYIHPQRGTRNCRTCLIETARARRAGKRGTGPCSETDCDRPASSRGMCPKHYGIWWRANLRPA